MWSPQKREPSARERTLRLWSELDALRDKLRELHQQAGIANAVENLSPPSGFPPDLDLPFGSEEARRAREIEEEHQSRRFARKLRQLYFGVPDLELRKELIQTSRLLDEKRIAEAWAATDEARGDLAKANELSKWWIVASAAGIGAVCLGYQLAGIAGAIGGALVGFFFGRSLEADTKARQEAAVASAEELFKLAQETARKVTDRGYIFS